MAKEGESWRCEVCRKMVEAHSPEELRECEAKVCPECHYVVCPDAKACASSGEANYFAEMGFTESDVLAYRERHAVEDFPVKKLSCGCVSHENGGPSDYPARCRR